MKVHRVNGVIMLRSTVERLVTIVIAAALFSVFHYLLDVLSKEENSGLAAVPVREFTAVMIAAPVILLILAAADWSCWLATSPDGIQHHTLLYHKSSSWENLQAIAQHKVSSPLSASEDQLLLKLPVRLDTRAPAWLINQFQASNTIPLSSIQHNWRDTELGKDLRRYAPHLITKS